MPILFMAFLVLNYGFIDNIMFIPKATKFKFKRYHRAHITQRITNSFLFPYLREGILGLKVLQFGFLFPKQLQAVYQTLNKQLKKKASIHFFAFPRNSLTTKKVGARMGKGKGKVLSSWVFNVSAGYVLCEIHTSYMQLAIKALKAVQRKFPLPSRIIINSFYEKKN